MRILNLFAAILSIALFLPTFVSAHSLNQSYVYFQIKEDGVSGRFEVSLNDINQVLPLDANGDGELTWEEFQLRQDDAFALMSDALKLSNGGTPLTIQSTGFDFFEGGDRLNGAIMAKIPFDVTGLTNTPEALEMSYEFLYNDVDKTHSGYAIIEENFRTGVSENEGFISLIFGSGDETQTLGLMGQSWFKVLVDFVVHGVWHIWIGYDHILFLVSLLISSVMVLVAGRWEPRETFGDAFWSVLKIVTLFTIAHSITLSLAALGWVRIPAPLIEFIIALSIAVMALDNIFPIFHRRAWLVILGFGLIHGFGFANVLAPLGVDPQHTAVTLAAFNIGVELGQAAIVAVLFPLLFLIRRSALYNPVVMKGLSLVLIAIALFWAWERSPDLIEGLSRIFERGTLTPS